LQLHRSDVRPQFLVRHFLVCHRQLPPEAHEVAALLLISVVGKPVVDDGLGASALALAAQAVSEIDPGHGWTLPTLMRKSGAAQFAALILTSAPIERQGRGVIRRVPAGRSALPAARGCG